MDGSLWGMGHNQFGQLGDGTTIQRRRPVKIVASGVESVAGSNSHTTIVKANGSLWSMGGNNYGQLGNGSTTDSSIPVQIETNGVVEASVGAHHTFYRKTDGSLWTVGHNGSGQLGDGTTSNRTTPVQIEASGVVSLADGSHSNTTRYTKSDGSAFAAGDNQFGQLGDGTLLDRNQSVQIVPSGVKIISSGRHFGFILLESGELKGFGTRSFGRLGDGLPLNYDWTKANIPSDVTDFDLGQRISSALDKDGTVWMTGLNSHGALGNESNIHRTNWASVSDTNSSSVAASLYHTLYLEANGSLWGMGKNGEGQLGLGDNTDRNKSVMIEPFGVKEIAVGSYHSVYLKKDGSLWTMGSNSWGQLGDGTLNNRNQPVQIESSGVVSISTGDWTTYYLKQDGSLWATGYNYHGQLGIGPTFGSGNGYQENRDRKSFTQIVASGVVNLVAGNINAFFIKEDGSLWGMGYGGYKAMGERIGNNHVRSPILIESSGVVTAGSGHMLSLFVKANGSVWGAGMHRFEEFGYESNDYEKLFEGPVLKVASKNLNAMLLVPANLPPQKVELTGGKIFENGNAGASVGHVVADDFDQDSKFTYSLVDGVGATHNDLFSIDANGSLIAQQSLDREVNATLSIRVQVMDEANRTLEKTFLIEVLDDPAEDLILPSSEQGLVAHWRFDEKNGSIAYDSSGNGYHAHLRGAGDEAWVENGKVNGAIQLDGLDDYLAIQGLHYSKPGEIQEITISCWIKTTQADKEGIIFSFDRNKFFRLSTGNLDVGASIVPIFTHVRVMEQVGGSMVVMERLQVVVG